MYFLKLFEISVHLLYSNFTDQVTGVVVDKDGTPKWVLQGTWDNKVEAAKVIKSHGSTKGKPILETATPKVLWKRVYPP